MATLEQLSTALRNADAAGDTEAAQKLAQAIKSMGAPGTQEPQTGMLEDVGRAALGGVGQGLEMTGGIFGDVANFGTAAGRWVGNQARSMMGKAPLTPQQEEEVSSGAWHPPSTADIKGLVGKVAPPVQKAIDYAPQTTAGKFANTAGTFVGGSVIGGPRAMLSAIPAAIGSEAAGQITKGTPFEPYARVVGSFAPPLMRRLVTPNPISASRRSAVDTLRREGVTDITAGQATGSNRLRYTESELGGARMADMIDRQGEQFTAAALRRAGINANRATPEVVDQAFTRIGNQFDTLSANNVARLDRPFTNDLRAALNYYSGRVSPPNRAPVIQNYAQEIAAAGHGGVIPGDVYQSLRSRISADARAAGDQYVQRTLNDMVGALDNAMERSIARFNPSQIGAWREARRQYRNMLVIEQAAVGAGEQAAAGLISPMRLRGATRSVMGTRSYARGRDEFSALARAGEEIMRPLPQSGTAPRLRAQKVFDAIPAMLGGGAGYALGGGDPFLAGLGVAAGSAAPALAGRAMLSAPGRAYLGNQLLAQPAPRTTAELLAAMNARTAPLRLPPSNSSR